jgi:hypothetical protein
MQGWNGKAGAERAAGWACTEGRIYLPGAARLSGVEVDVLSQVLQELDQPGAVLLHGI